MNLETLMKFCHADDGLRHDIASPWFNGTHTFATDGRICLMIIGQVEGVSDDKEGRPNALILFNDFNEFGPFEPIATVDLPPKETTTCRDCGGLGKIYKCRECHGEGVLECDLGHEHECRGCWGKGFHMDGIGKGDSVPCFECEGIGQITTVVGVRFGKASLGSEYLRLIAENLPNAAIYTPSDVDSAQIKFDGGKGLLMPMRIR